MLLPKPSPCHAYDRQCTTFLENALQPPGHCLWDLVCTGYRRIRTCRNNCSFFRHHNSLHRPNRRRSCCCRRRTPCLPSRHLWRTTQSLCSTKRQGITHRMRMAKVRRWRRDRQYIIYVQRESNGGSVQRISKYKFICSIHSTRMKYWSVGVWPLNKCSLSEVHLHLVPS